MGTALLKVLTLKSYILIARSALNEVEQGLGAKTIDSLVVEARAAKQNLKTLREDEMAIHFNDHFTERLQIKLKCKSGSGMFTTRYEAGDEAVIDWENTLMIPGKKKIKNDPL